MMLKKFSTAVAVAATLVSGAAFAGVPVRASGSLSMAHPVAARVGSLGTTARTGVAHKGDSQLAGGGLIIGVLAAAAVVAGVIAATSHHHDNGASN